MSFTYCKSSNVIFHTVVQQISTDFEHHAVPLWQWSLSTHFQHLLPILWITPQLDMHSSNAF